MRSRASVVIVEGEHVLLIKRVNKGRTYYVFPGGGIEAGELPQKAAVREAYEELGTHVKLEKIIDVINMDGMQYFFKAKIISGTIGSGEGEEYTNTDRGTYEPMFVPVADLHKLPVFPKEIIEKVRIMGGN